MRLRVCYKTTNYCDKISIIVTQLCAPCRCEYLCERQGEYLRLCVCACMAHLLLSHCKRASKSSLVPRSARTRLIPLLPSFLHSKDAHNICCTRTHTACG